MANCITLKYGDRDYFYYIRLGDFLRFIKDNLIYQFKTGDTVTSALEFDTEVQSNLMYIDPLQVSLDPTICVVNRTLLIDGSSYIFAPDGDPFESPILGTNYGQIMNIYLNMRYVLIKLDELKDPNDNKVVLIDFLNNILSAVNSSLGGTTKLEASLNEATVVIIDGNPLPNLKEVIRVLNDKVPNTKLSSEYAKFDLYGYNTKDNTAGFIKDFSFTTEITPALSTMITVGATANSTVVGENSTAFSRFNAGLTDRFKEQVVEPIPGVKFKDFTTGTVTTYQVGNPFEAVGSGTPSTTKNSEEQKFIDELVSKYTKTYGTYIKYLKRLGGEKKNYEDGEGATFKDAVTNYNIYLNQIKQVFFNREIKKLGKPINSNRTATPGTGFIPFNMSLTMDGLSGMKIYSKFLIDTKYLPANYPDNADFLIKGVEHKIENNKWTTNISSVVISQGTMDSSKQVDIGGTNQNKNASAVKLAIANAPKVKTTPSGFDLLLGSFNQKVTTKKQIYLHHTAGAQFFDKGKGTVDVFNTRTAINDPASTHTVIDKGGHIEYLFDDKYVSYHAGTTTTRVPNEAGLSVELQSYGYLTEVNGKFYNAYKGEIPRDQVATAVDINGKPKAYKDHLYYHKYTPAQIASVKNLILSWSAKHKIPVKWLGQKSYDALFPPNKGLSQEALTGVPGLYTHNSVRTDKSDVFPQKELIEMLKTL
jgi:hypothetical protein